MRLEDFGIPGGKRKTLVVLGAGASRGASFVTGEIGVLPPLDVDFFQQLTRIPDCAAGARLMEFVRAEYGHEAGLSMERFFSEADYTHRFHEEVKVDRGAKVRRYGRALDDFFEALAALLRLATSDDCTFHGRLADRLHADDTVLTFNYDCIVDRALRDHAGNRWDPDKEGYGFSIAGGGATWRRHGKGQHPKTSIELLKMHGSANWRTKATTVSLRDPGRASTLKGSIIPPSWFKDLASAPFASVWKKARIAVRRARIILVVGYSVPQTDLFSRSLFKVEAGSKEKREKLDLLVLVNPDRAARRYFVDLVREGLEPTTRVLEFSRLKDLGSLLG